jgi:threonine aldolase
MRFLSAQWVGLLQDGAWLRHAKHSNAMAKRLEAAIRPLPNVQVSYPVESNAVFATIPEPVVAQMHKRGWKFYTHVGGWEDSRLMCSWDTTPEDVDGFAADLKELVGGAHTGKLTPARA